MITLFNTFTSIHRIFFLMHFVVGRRRSANECRRRKKNMIHNTNVAFSFVAIGKRQFLEKYNVYVCECFVYVIFNVCACVWHMTKPAFDATVS